MTMPLPPDDLPCQELVELVTDYLEDRLPDSERRRFDAHLLDCSGCRTYLEQVRLMVQALGALRAESIEPEMKDRLLGAFRDWRRSG
jgi:anti-sigma factor RsiW